MRVTYKLHIFFVTIKATEKHSGSMEAITGGSGQGQDNRQRRPAKERQ
jgi:hypothetical protein